MKHLTITLLTFMLILNVIASAQPERTSNWDQIKSSFTSDVVLLNSHHVTSHKEPIGSVWQPIGPNSNDILGFCFGDPNADIIYSASRVNGIFKTINEGVDWIQINNGITDNFIRAIASHPRNDNIVLAGTFNKGLFRTINGGIDWNFVDSIGDPTIFDITFDPHHSDTVYVGTRSNGVYRSSDAGITWQHLSPDTTNIALEVIVDPLSSNIVYHLSGNGDSEVYKSIDYGDNWTVFFEGNVILLSLAINPQNSDIIYMGALNDSLYKSINGGQTWEKIPINDDTHIVEDILIDFNNVSNVYLATVTAGVFLSTDGGFTWNELNDGLTTGVVLKLKFDPLTTSTLYASTNGGAIFRIEDLVTDLDQSEKNYPKYFLLFQNYPNPFNPTTRITYSIARSGFVILKVYDLLGREVRTLVDEVQEANSYSVIFDASKLASGVYFCRMQVGSDFVETRKMLLMQ